MVLWCKTCGALLGLGEPHTDWSTDRTTICEHCLPKPAESQSPPAADNDTAEHAAMTDTAKELRISPGNKPDAPTRP